MADKLLGTVEFNKERYFDQIKQANFIASSRLEGIEVVCTNESEDEIIARYKNKDTVAS